MRSVHWQALSYSTALTPLLANCAPFTLSVLSTHQHACNLCTADGAIIALVTPFYHNGPFHIVVSAPQFPLFPQTTQAQHGVGILALGRIKLALVAAEAWNPQLPLLQVSPATAYSSLHEEKLFTKSAFHTGPLAQILRAQLGIIELEQGIKAGDIEGIDKGVVALAGLGPGLTPAGDDFLVGVLAALHATAHYHERTVQWQQLIHRIADTAAPRTTRLSAAWLHHAGQGHFGQHWHDLIAALNSAERPAIEQAVARIIAIGATSGADALFGFTTALGWCDK